MATKFSQDVIPLSDVKVNPGKIVKQVAKEHRPALLTSRGRGVAVMQSVTDFESDAEERQFMRAVVQGMLDLEEGRELSLAEVKKRLNLGR
jgi:prevent-host-death family protein